jgi:hypothetical protein
VTADLGQFIQPTADRAARNARGAHHSAHPAKPSGYCFSRRKTPPTLLVKHRSERFKPQPNRRFVNHPNLIS